MKLYLKINGEEYGMTRPENEDANLTFWDMYAMFYRITRMSGLCSDELDKLFGGMDKDMDDFLKGDIG